MGQNHDNCEYLYYSRSLNVNHRGEVGTRRKWIKKKWGGIKCKNLKSIMYGLDVKYALWYGNSNALTMSVDTTCFHLFVFNYALFVAFVTLDEQL